MEDTYRDIVESLPVLICRFLPGDGTITLVNKAYCECFGRTRDELIGRSFLELVPRDDHARVKRHFQSLDKDNPIVTYEHPVFTPEGMRWQRWTDQALMDEKDTVVEYQSVGQDITDKVKAENELRISEKKYETIFETTGAATIITDEDSTISLVNREFERLSGYSKQEIEGKMSWRTFILREDLDLLLTYFDSRKIAPRLVPQDIEFRFVNKQGAVRNVISKSHGIQVTNQTVTSLLDITGRLQSEESLKIMDSAIKSSINAIAISDLEGRLTYVNRSFLEMWGYEDDTEILGRSAFEFWIEDEKARQVVETLHRDGSWVGEMIAKKRDESHFNAQLVASLVKDDRGTPIRMMSAFLDVTHHNQMVRENMKLEKQIRQAQKMEAIGTLAGGIAHDFNNMLSGILGYTELALLEVPEGSSLRKKLHSVLNSGNRAKDLVNQILTFSQQRELDKKPISVGSVVKDALNMIRATVPSNIEIFRKLDCDEDIIEADATQIHQIVVNLCTNAYHAVRENPGFIEVTLRDLNLDSNLVIDHAQLPAGPYVELAVTDTGEGMTPEVMEKIFDPYFTTKKKGDGTGLGLSVVHGIVQSLGGAITVESIPGKGSSFKVYFPRIQGKETLAAGQPGAMPSGRERILLVDDETMIIDMVKNMLEHLGYEVITRSSSLEALELFRVRHDEIDLVISDVNMPRMTGLQLAERLLEIRSDIPVILGTGYSEMVTEHKALELGIQHIMKKPLIMKELAATIRTVLDGR